MFGEKKNRLCYNGLSRGTLNTRYRIKKDNFAQFRQLMVTHYHKCPWLNFPILNNILISLGYSDNTLYRLLRPKQLCTTPIRSLKIVHWRLSGEMYSSITDPVLSETILVVLIYYIISNITYARPGKFWTTLLNTFITLQKQWKNNLFKITFSSNSLLLIIFSSLWTEID